MRDRLVGNDEGPEKRPASEFPLVLNQDDLVQVGGDGYLVLADDLET